MFMACQLAVDVNVRAYSKIIHVKMCACVYS
jgi:hypothetical protein